MARKRPLTEVEAKVQIHKIHAVAEVLAKTLSELIKWGVLAFITWQIAPVIQVTAEAWAGKETIAHLSFEWLMNEHAGQVLGLLFGGGGILYGKHQAKLRKEVIERLHKYQLQYEQDIDPNRSSSKLTPTGETRAEDA